MAINLYTIYPPSFKSLSNVHNFIIIMMYQNSKDDFSNILYQCSVNKEKSI